MNKIKEEDFANAPETWEDGTSFISKGIGTYTQLTGTIETLGDGNDEQFGIDDSDYLALSPFAELELELGKPVRYFGFAWPAGDANNRITVYNSETVLFTLDTADVVNILPNNPLTTVTSIDGNTYNTQDYYGQPSTGLNGGEAYAYIHIIADANDTFDKIVFEHRRDQGKFETDNHAIINLKDDVTPKGEFVILYHDAQTQLPEPKAYALIFGLLSLGFATIRRSSGASVASPRPDTPASHSSGRIG